MNIADVPDRFPPRSHYEAEMQAEFGDRWNWTAAKVVEESPGCVKGKVFVVTGANVGLGKETARALVKGGARVIATARDEAKCAEIEKELGDGVKALPLDLCSFEKVEGFLGALEAEKVKVDGFINNAGTMANPFRLTSDGYEMQIQVNFLSVVVLFVGLVKRQLMQPEGRMVVVSSAAHLNGDCEVAKLNWKDEEGYNKWVAYCQAKGAVILFTNWLAKKLQEKGSKITVNSLHPGGIWTNLMKDLSTEEMKALGFMDKEGNRHTAGKTIEEGAATQTYAAVHPEMAGKTGCYLENSHITPPTKGPNTDKPQYVRAGVLPYVFNEERQAELMKVAAEKLGRSLEL